jgi:hypothetical protein
MLTVSWNILGVRISTFAGQQNVAVLAVDHVLFSRVLPPSKTARAPQDYGAEEIQSAGDLVQLVHRLIMPVTKIGTALYRQSSFEDVRGSVRIGLGDPVATGMLYGGYRATQFVLVASRIYLDVVPVFDRQILEVELDVRFRINHPLRILVTATRIAQTTDARTFISKIYRKKQVAQ